MSPIVTGVAPAAVVCTRGCCVRCGAVCADALILGAARKCVCGALVQPLLARVVCSRCIPCMSVCGETALLASCYDRSSRSSSDLEGLIGLLFK